MDPLKLDHEAAEDLLAAYVDGELPQSVASQIEVHLGECERCPRAVAAQIAVRDQLAAEPVTPASAAFRERVVAAVGNASKPAARAVPLPRVLPWLGWATAAGLAAVLLLREPRADSAPVAAPPPPTAQGSVNAAPRPPMVDEALADYRRRIAGNLPLDGARLREVQARMPFPVVPLDSSQAQLIGAWTTEILGQPAAVLAYRWRDQVLLQYAVSEGLFFAPAQVRQAVASHGQYLTRSGQQTVLAWPQIRSGSILVSDLPAAELTPLRS